jgi:hypothetical protein
MSYSDTSKKATKTKVATIACKGTRESKKREYLGIHGST